MQKSKSFGIDGNSLVQSSHLYLGDPHVWEIIEEDCGKSIFSNLSDPSEIQEGEEEVKIMWNCSRMPY